ncbi:hypothetical protein C0989_004125 [Termitomyces sp. Mn162]|nr:hypothetical protein C0989_004125 [Termitomyces sp. Mn162]
MSSSSIKEQPTAAMDLPVLDSTCVASHTELSTGTSLKGRAMAWRKKVLTREGWLGDYNYTWLCTPALPFLNKPRSPPFYGLDVDLPLVLAISCGLQHALAMLAGLITPPIIFASALNLDPATSAYMISASLIGCGILSSVQISRIRIFRNYYLGTGLISVVGTSFATLSTATAIFDAMYKDGTCPSVTSAAGVVTRKPCPDAYGKVLGTSLVCAFLEIFMSFLPARVLKLIFPPIVTGTVVLMIGASLIGSSGVLNWGGGSNGCINGTPGTYNELCPTIYAPRPLPVIIGLVTGCIVAGGTGYIDGSSIKSAPGITFLWVHRFKIGVYPPAILPMLAVYVSLAMEAIGDITASAEVSRVKVQGPEFETRIQGGVLVCFLAPHILP